MRIDHTPLPGIGRLHVFTTRTGQCLGVVHRHDDRRELVIYHADAVAEHVPLTAEEAQGLGELLDVATLTHHVALLDHHASGIVTLQLLLDPDAPPGHLADAVRVGRPAAILAVLRDGRLIADPVAAGPVRRGDLAIIVGALADALAVMNGLHWRGG